MASDPDALWKPGAPEPAPAAERLREEPVPARGLPDRFQPAVRRSPTTVTPSAVSPRDAPEHLVDVAPPEIVTPDGWVVERDEQRARRPSWRTVVVAAIAVVAIFAGGVVIARLLTDDPDPVRPEPGALSGTDVRRLPDSVEELWSTTLRGTGNAATSSIIVDGRDLAVVAVDDGSKNRSSIVGLDAESGEIRWRRSFSFAPPEVSFLAVIDGVVLIELTDPANRRLLALASADGETVWERRIGGNSINAVPLGTELIANFIPEVYDVTTFYDPATGEPVGEVPGVALTTDLDGTWYHARDRDLLAVDLADGWSEPVVVVEDGPPMRRQTVVIDDRILVVDDARRLRELDLDEKRLVPVAGDELPEITRLVPVGGSSFVADNEDEVFGVELDDRGVRLTWLREASVRNFGLTERGMALTLSDPGIGFSEGGDLQVVDGLTGERLAGAGPVDNVEDVPLIVGDGFVTVTEVVEGDERRGFDLEGNELWRVVVGGRLRVGDELLVVLDNPGADYRVTAYGSAG